MLRKLGLAAIPLLIFLGSLELALRLFPQVIRLKVLIEFEPGIRSSVAARRGLQQEKDTVPIPREDGGPSDRLWRYRGGAEVRVPPEPGVAEVVRMDDEGFCNAPADAYTAEDRFDMVVVGDSFVFCTGVEPGQAWPSRLADATGFRVYNLGLPGRGLYEYLETLRAYGLGRRPRAVILGVYEGNDLRDAHLYHQSQADPARRIESELCPFQGESACDVFLALKHGFPGAYSYAWNLGAGALAKLLHDSRKDAIDFRYDVRFPDGEVLPFNSRNADQDEVQYARRLLSGVVGPELFDDALGRFVELAAQHDFVPLVVYQPSAHTAYAALSRFEDGSIEDSLQRASERLRDHFARRGRELGYAFLDLTPVLQEQARQRTSQEQLYFQKNIHLTAVGHQVVARRVEAWLREPGIAAALGRHGLAAR